MAELYAKAVLTIKGNQYDVLSFSYELYRQLDNVNKPTGNVFGGVLYLTINSYSESTDLLELLTVKGKCDSTLEIKKSDGKSLLREVKFQECYVSGFAERLNGNIIQQDIQITAKKIISGNAQHENNWS